MASAELMTYQQVLESLNKKGRQKHLFLGNGFSMSYDSGIFSYNALYIGVYSDSDLKHLKSIEKKFKCYVRYFDAKTVNVWELANPKSKAHLQTHTSQSETKNCKRAYLFANAFLPTLKTNFLETAVLRLRRLVIVKH